jgi:2-polyprenyl-3-methyl-5-hydroxy-6-metoxy-1,4-benzoquinol methylase
VKRENKEERVIDIGCGGGGGYAGGVAECGHSGDSNA